MQNNIVKQTGLEKLNSVLTETFAPLNEQTAKESAKAKAFLEVAKQNPQDLKTAKALKKEFISLRKEATAQHKELKSGVLDIGRKIDTQKNLIFEAIKEVEQPLDQFIKFEKLERERKLKELQTEREALLSPFQDIGGLDLANMSDQNFELMLEGAKARKAQLEREAIEREQALARAKELQSQKEALEREKLKAQLEQERLEREAIEKQQALERAEREKALALEREAKRKREALEAFLKEVDTYIDGGRKTFLDFVKGLNKEQKIEALETFKERIAQAKREREAQRLEQAKKSKNLRLNNESKLNLSGQKKKSKKLSKKRGIVQRLGIG